MCGVCVYMLHMCMYDVRVCGVCVRVCVHGVCVHTFGAS